MRRVKNALQGFSTTNSIKHRVNPVRLAPIHLLPQRRYVILVCLHMLRLDLAMARVASVTEAITDSMHPIVRHARWIHMHPNLVNFNALRAPTIRVPMG